MVSHFSIGMSYLDFDSTHPRLPMKAASALISTVSLRIRDSITRYPWNTFLMMWYPITGFPKKDVLNAALSGAIAMNLDDELDYLVKGP